MARYFKFENFREGFIFENFCTYEITLSYVDVGKWSRILKVASMSCKLNAIRKNKILTKISEFTV